LVGPTTKGDKLQKRRFNMDSKRQLQVGVGKKLRRNKAEIKKRRKEGGQPNTRHGQTRVSLLKVARGRGGGGYGNKPQKDTDKHPKGGKGVHGQIRIHVRGSWSRKGGGS